MSAAANEVAARAAAVVAAEKTAKDYQPPRSPLARTPETEAAVEKAVRDHDERRWPILIDVLKNPPKIFLQRLRDHLMASPADMVKTYLLSDNKDESDRFLLDARSNEHVRLAVFPGAVSNFGDEMGCRGDVLGFLEQVAGQAGVALSSPSAALINKQGGELRSRTPQQLTKHVQEHGGVFVYGAPIALEPQMTKGVDGLGRNGFNCKPAVNAALSAGSEGVATVVAATDISSDSSRDHVFPDSTGATQLSLYGNDGGGYTSFHMDTTQTKWDGQNVGLPGQLRRAGILPMVTYKDGSTVDGLDSFNHIIGNGQAVSLWLY
jgi:hypothetical protein